MMKSFPIPLTLVLLLTTVSAAAQTTDAVEDAEVRRYTVEMIIFSYLQDISPGSEIFVADPPATDPSPAEVVDFSDETEPVEIEEREYDIEILSKEALSMQDIHARMRRSAEYRPLMHFAWTQSTLPEAETRERPLSEFARPPAGLDGFLTLYLSRYLHLEVDLKLDAPSSAQSDSRYREESNVRYHINENRILKNGETRYFDHPKFGVLAKVTRVEDDDDEPVIAFQ